MSSDEDASASADTSSSGIAIDGKEKYIESNSSSVLFSVQEENKTIEHHQAQVFLRH